jgi:hypothetical protein
LNVRNVLRLYPKAWRERYGEEILAQLDHRGLTLGEVWDVMRAALEARFRPALAGSFAFIGGPGRMFIPHVGFRPPGLRMPRPIRIDQGNRSLVIRQLIVTAERTELAYDILCAPDECARIGRRYEGVTLLAAGQKFGLSGNDFQSAQAGFGKVTRTLRLQPIPQTVREVEVRVTSDVFGEWSSSIRLEPFEFRPTSAETTPNSVATHAGVTLTLRAASFTETETAVEIHASSDLLDAAFHGLGGFDGMRSGPTLLRLRDQNGREYAEPPWPGAEGYEDPAGETHTVLFEPLPPNAVDLELEIPFVFLEVRAGRIEFEVPVTEPVGGKLGGNEIRVLATREARTTRGAYVGPTLALDVDLGGWQDDRRVLKPQEAAIDAVSTELIVWRIRATDPEPPSTIELPVTPPVEAAKVRLTGATMQIRGPWRLRFTRGPAA